MSSFDDVYSEDGNVLIGEDFMTQRLRREVRQLHCSKFKRTRREAHFTRYRNSSLKCDLDRRDKRIDLERKMKSAERERAMGALLKQLEERRKMNLVHTGETAIKLSPVKSVKQIQASIKGGKNGSGLAGSRKLAGNRVMKSSRVSSSLRVYSGNLQSANNDNSQNIDNEDKPSKNASVAVSIPASKQSAASKRTVVGFSNHISLLNRNKESVAKLQRSEPNNLPTRKSAQEECVWQEFDRIMKNFAKFLQIECKSVIHKATIAKKLLFTKPSPHVNFNSFTSFKSLYYRYGAPDQIVFRL